MFQYLNFSKLLSSGFILSPCWLIIFSFIQLPTFSQSFSLKPFPLSSVRILDGPFKNAQQTDLKYILALEPDRLLSPYLREAGIKPKAESYGNWENTGLDGHIEGHYLSALSNMYATTGNKELFRRINYIINWLKVCQQKNGDGYVGGIPGGKAMWQEIEKGKINASSFSLNGKWVPWYNLHKLYAGLRDAYLIAGNTEAKNILIRLSDWCLNLTSNLSDAQMQRMLRSEHGGMNEVLADVAAITGDTKYLKLAIRFSDEVILNPLIEDKDSLTGLHANTQIPKVIGYGRIAEISKNKDWANAARFFWETVVQNRTVSIGGNSVSEHFNPSNDFSSMIESKEGIESCNTYNMLRLTKLLFLENPSGNYMDYYERALYNHILSSQNPKGGFVYFTPMRPRHYRVYSQPDLDFWCCVGTGLENHGKYGDLIYAHNDKDIFVNLFMASTLEWKEKGITLVQNTKFPFEETTEIKLKLEKPSEFSLHFRYPSWVKKGQMKVRVNNKEFSVKPDAFSYVSVKRIWKSGDVVSLVLPMQTKVEYMPDHSQWISFVHGPIVLAAITDTTDLQGLFADGSRMGHVANGPLYPLDESPFILTSSKDTGYEIKPVRGESLTFTADQIISSNKYKKLKLVPFFEIHNARYIVYWPVSAPDKLNDVKEMLRLKEKEKIELESRTIDKVAPGQQQPEVEHNLQGEKTSAGSFNNRHYRNAEDWFSYDLKNPNKDVRILRITFYGKNANRKFDIYLNETLLTTMNTDGSRGDKFFDVDYKLPERIKGENKLIVKFVATEGFKTADIYYIRLLK